MSPRLLGAVLVAATAVSIPSCGSCEPRTTGSTSSPPRVGSAAPPAAEAPVVSAAVVIDSVSRANTAFTQGLAFWEGRLFEGTGMHGESVIRELDPDTGRELRRAALDAKYFGEGITILKGRLYQLTWQQHTCLVYDAASFRQVEELAYEGEGWGLTNDGTSLIMSDGSAWLRFRDPASFKVTRSIQVTLAGRPIPRINELEYIHGEIWANVWYDKAILRISPADGRVVALVDAAKLVDSTPRSSDVDDVLNGIAFDPDSGKLLITGKRWPVIYKIERPR